LLQSVSIARPGSRTLATRFDVALLARALDLLTFPLRWII
jgi:hypothetical protein